MLDQWFTKIINQKHRKHVAMQNMNAVEHNRGKESEQFMFLSDCNLSLDAPDFCYF